MTHLPARRHLAMVQPEPPPLEEEELPYRAVDDAFEQASEARDRLYVAPAAYLHLPWHSLDRLVGGIAPTDVWFVAGFSGNGKTTWLLNLVYEYLTQGRTVYYLGLETRPAILRTHLACLRLGLYAGDVLSGACYQWPDWERVTRPRLVEEFEAQRHLGKLDRFLVNGVPMVDEQAIRGACHDAAMERADVMVIDHVDHLRASEGRSTIEESIRVVQLLLRLAHDQGLRILVATQCNNEGVRGDPLGLYQPPQPHHVYMGSHKRMIATGMLGLYRPMAPTATKDQIADVRAKRREPREILAPNTMGIVIMKHRYYGSREGERTALRLERGRLFDLPDPHPTPHREAQP